MARVVKVGNGPFLRLIASGALLLRGGGLPWDYSGVSSLSPDASPDARAARPGPAEPFAAESFAAEPFAAEATLDNDASEIFDGTLTFIRDHVRSQTP